MTGDDPLQSILAHLSDVLWEDALIEGVQVVIKHVDSGADILSPVFGQGPCVIDADDHVVRVNERSIPFSL